MNQHKKILNHITTHLCCKMSQSAKKQKNISGIQPKIFKINKKFNFERTENIVDKLSI